MTYALSKMILALLLPPASLVILMLLGFLLIGCCRGFGKLLLLIGIAGLYCLSISPVSDALLKPLESFARPIADSRIKPEAIVVLGGGTLDLAWTGLGVGLTQESEARVVHGVALYRKYHRPIVLVGGRANPADSKTPDADAMAQIARSLGVPDKDLVLENTSRNTRDGARALASQVKTRRIILVTSAYHMKRAVAMFKKQGFEVTPAPTAYLSEQKPSTLFSFIPRAPVLAASAVACSEYLSLRWYSLQGDL